MEFDLQWLLLGLPLAFALGWLASRFDLRQWRREQQDSPRAYFKGLNLLLNEQQDKAIDAFIEAVQHDPDSAELHFALGNLFRRRGEYERAVRVHEHLLARADLPATERDRAQHALAQDYLKAGLFDRAEQAYRALEGTAFATDARLALQSLYERSRDWRAAIEIAGKLDQAGAGSFAARIAHYWCEIAAEADERQAGEEAQAALQEASRAAPQAARPRIMVAQRLARSGAMRPAFDAWLALLQAHPEVSSLVAQEVAAAAEACEAQAEAVAALRRLYQNSPSIDLLGALQRLEPDAATRAHDVREHLRQQPSLSAALAVLPREGSATLGAEDLTGLRAAIDRAVRPLQRYRCAACGFEAQRYFWQCPGCLSWDSYPTRRVEEL